MYKIEDLVFFVWQIDETDRTGRYTELTKEALKGLVLDLKNGTWSFTGEATDPNNGTSYPIGGHAGRLKNGYRICPDGTFPYGPIGVFDKTNFQHLSNLVDMVEDYLKRRMGRK